MKTKLITLTVVLLTLIGGFTSCNKQNGLIYDYYDGPLYCGGNGCLNFGSGKSLSVSCEFHSFLESASWQTHVIVAEMLEETYQHGRKVRVIEDLAGNFPKDISTFMAWGAPGGTAVWGLDANRSGFVLSCSDCLKTGDRLVLLLAYPYNIRDSNRKLSDFFPELEPDYEWILTLLHLVTQICSESALRLEDGYVIGSISKWDTQRMSLHNFRRELNNVIRKSN